MMRYVSIFGFALLLTLATGSVSVAKPSKPELIIPWDSVTAETWSCADTFPSDVAAVMLLDRVLLDDRNWLSDKCFVIIYQRVRIRGAEGRKWADVSVPILDSKQKFQGAQGRVILRDGAIVDFDPGQIITKEIVKAKGLKVQQQAFSLPGVTDDCIVEHAIRLRLPSNYDVWKIEKEIPLLRGELIWQFYRSENSYDGILDAWLTSLYGAPNYTRLNLAQPLKIEQLPSLTEPKEIRFSVADVPPFKSEPHSLPAKFLQAQLRLYYGDRKAPAAYWGDVSTRLQSMLSDFTKKKKRLQEIVKPFDSLLTEEAKLEAVYAWVQKNITNSNFRPSDDTIKVEDEEWSIDALLKTNVGSRDQINLLYCLLMRELNVDAHLAYAVDRDEDLLVQEVKRWQFDRSMVAIDHTDNTYSFYSPGEAYLPAGEVPWTTEGIRAIVGGARQEIFTVISFSTSKENRLTRNVNFNVTDDWQLTGTTTETRSGHEAADLRRTYLTASSIERPTCFMSLVKDEYPGAEIDSLVAESLLVNNQRVVLKAKLNISDPGLNAVGSRILLKPMAYLAAAENPFTAGERKYPVMMPWAFEHNDLISFTLPAGWLVETVPEPLAVTNDAGTCVIQFSRGEGTVSMHRKFVLEAPFFSQDSYPQVQELYEAYVRNSGATVTLTQSMAGGQ